MEVYRKIIKVFLASPGDLEDERKAAHQIVQEENNNHANTLGFHIELVGWEDTVAQFRRAQEAINRDLDQCEYFVGLMWKRWGTPPGPEGHPYSSGFEEEYCRSVERFKNDGKPEISLLFKNVSDDAIADAGPELAKVLEFQENVENEKIALFQKFGSLRNFEQKFRAIISHYLTIQSEESDDVITDEPASSKPPKNKENQPTKDKLFEKSAHIFLENIITEGRISKEIEPSSAARFRLIANSISREGNDNIVLGVHDSNLIYRHLREIAFSKIEIRNLIRSGLENLENENAPLWHWIFSGTKNAKKTLSILTIVGSDDQRKNAFKALEILAIPTDEIILPVSDSNPFERWLSEPESEELKISALSYIGKFGSTSELEHVEPFLNSSEANVARAAVSAKIRILASNSISEALVFISGREESDIAEGLAEKLMENAGSIPTNILKKCLRNRSILLRRFIAQELLNRNELNEDDAENLCKSEDAKTRLVGAFALRSATPGFSLSDAKKLLIKPLRSSGPLVLLGSKQFDYPGREAFRDFEIDVYSERDLDELNKINSDSTALEKEAVLAAYGKYFSKFRGEIIDNLRDLFITYCETKLGKMGKFKDPEIIRKELVHSTLAIFCLHAKHSDIDIIRETLDKQRIHFDEQIVSFFHKFGELEDIERIIQMSKNEIGYEFRGFYTADTTNNNHRTAKAILKIGKNRLADVLTLSMPSNLRAEIVRVMPETLFKSFDDDQIVSILRDDDDDVRKNSVLQSIKCLSKTRLTELLISFSTAEDRYYYNVIFWFDLGLSLSVKAAAETAKRLLKGS